jgi:hypothetical protein
VEEEKLTSQNKFKEAYEQAVIEGLSILGHNLSSVITSYIQDKYSIRLSDTADDPKALSDALNNVMDGGARIVQRRIIRSLYNRIGLSLPFVILINFEDKIHDARKEYEKKYG